jgi:DNA-binding phage protein
VLLEFSAEDKGFGFVARSMGWRGNDLFKTVVSIGTPAFSAVHVVSSQPPCEEALSTVDNPKL